jgi:hypothetical protein
MQDAGRVKKPPATDKKSSAANALIKAAMAIVDTAESDDDDMFDPWDSYFPSRGYVFFNSIAC